MNIQQRKLCARFSLSPMASGAGSMSGFVRPKRWAVFFRRFYQIVLWALLAVVAFEFAEEQSRSTLNYRVWNRVVDRVPAR